MNEKPTYYAIIPSKVRYDQDLSSSEKLFYGELTVLTNKIGVCFAKNEYFADLYNVSKRTITNWISNLKNKGYIKVLIQYKKGTKEIKQRAIILDEAMIINNIKNFNLSKTSKKKRKEPSWLHEDIEENLFTPEELAEFEKMLEQL